MRKTLVPVCICLLLLCLVSCKKSGSDGSIVKREGKPDVFNVASENEEMNKAVAAARVNIPVFLDALKSPKSGQSGFAVKKLYKEGESDEHIWLTDVTFDGKILHGVVDNEPVYVKNVKLGDKATVSPEEISDWMYVDDGKLRGGYTIRVLYNHQSPEEKKRFVQETGLIIE